MTDSLLTYVLGYNREEQNEIKRARKDMEKPTESDEFELIFDFKQTIRASFTDGHGRIMAVLASFTLVSVFDGKVSETRLEIDPLDVPTALLHSTTLGESLIGTMSGCVYTNTGRLVTRGPNQVVSILELEHGPLVVFRSGDVVFLNQSKGPSHSLKAKIDKCWRISLTQALALSMDGTLLLIQVNDLDSLNIIPVSVPSGRVRDVQPLNASFILLLTWTMPPNWTICELVEDEENMISMLNRLDYVTNNASHTLLLRELNQHAALVQTAVALKTEHIRCALSITRRSPDLTFRIQWSQLGEQTSSASSLRRIVMIFRIELGGNIISETLSKVLEDRNHLDITPQCYCRCSDHSTRMLPIRVEITSYVLLGENKSVSKVCAIQQFDALETGALEQIPLSAAPVLSKPFRVAYLPRKDWPSTMHEGTDAASVLRTLVPKHWSVEAHSPLKASTSTSLVRISLAFDGANVDLSFIVADAFTASIVHAALLQRLKTQVDVWTPPRITLQAKRAVAQLTRMVEALKDSDHLDVFEESRATKEALQFAVSTWELIRSSAKFSVES